MAARILALGST